MSGPCDNCKWCESHGCNEHEAITGPARTAAPSVEPFGKCETCGAVLPARDDFWTHKCPDPVAGLREALDVWERNGAPNRRSLEAFGIRPTLLAEPVPPRAAPCDDEQLKVAFMKGVQSAHESRAEPVPLDAWAMAGAIANVFPQLFAEDVSPAHAVTDAGRLIAEYARLTDPKGATE